MIEVLFTLFSATALGGWILLIGFPRWARGRDWIIGALIPLIFSVAYLLLFVPLYFSAPGGYGSLEELTTLLLSDNRILLAAWLHYLAFDLLIGRYILVESQEEGIRHSLMVVPLLLCFLFGPVGWLSFKILKVARDGLARSA